MKIRTIDKIIKDIKRTQSLNENTIETINNLLRESNTTFNQITIDKTADINAVISILTQLQLTEDVRSKNSLLLD